ncbi:hypothetical protein G6F68_021372 [Rhizopus microsporus]|nr:hypothetical protein G6F68_021372 [Rhizopus microsporus]
MDQGRRMVRALGCEEELRLLVSTMLDDCYSTDNMNRNEMMHNWTVPSIPHLHITKDSDTDLTTRQTARDRHEGQGTERIGAVAGLDL